ncbi:TPA: AAA family ATPase [Legionella pneumophila]|uniref:AAA family ATPase n=1 Tax=Legionella pneumophila TaxID=446 RepID=A0AAN5KSY0_LEGPN|nr:AAA family ATPase [Legionella pneumophila]HAT1972299.1 AAA family ATPase [Legionella pneumophila]
MLLNKVLISGYRNFKNAVITLNAKSLIIGPNDIGKSNFLRAIRLLLDRNLSDAEIEPNDADFYAFEDTHKIEITLYFIEATEDCIKSRFKENISNDDELIIQYQATRDPLNGQKTYQIYVGPTKDNLKSCESRFYLKVLNLHYIGSNRDLNAFIKKEKKYLLGIARENRTNDEIDQDNASLKSIEATLKDAGGAIAGLHFVSKATDSLNIELSSLSSLNEDYNLCFDTGASDIRQYIDNLSLASSHQGNPVALGGDGKYNQVYLAIWSAQRKVLQHDPTQVSINCIEEPEAHLHPHQQRKLSQYLSNQLQGQVLLTSHSPHIACEFEHNSIISLSRNQNGSYAASNGCSDIIENSLHNFGHRLNVIPAEGFFSAIVFLVEGVSEVLFYKALAKKLEIDLDKYNVSIIPVEGIGFETFIEVYKSLGVRFIVKTDFDICKVPKHTHYRAAGLQRGLKILTKYNQALDSNVEILIKTLGDSHKNLPEKKISKPLKAIIADLRNSLKQYGIFFSDSDLETDLAQSALKSNLMKWYDVSDKRNLVKLMKESKGVHMFQYLKENYDSLIALKNSTIAEPLKKCIEWASKK